MCVIGLTSSPSAPPYSRRVAVSISPSHGDRDSRRVDHTRRGRGCGVSSAIWQRFLRIVFDQKLLFSRSLRRSAFVNHRHGSFCKRSCKPVVGRKVRHLVNPRGNAPGGQTGYEIPLIAAGIAGMNPEAGHRAFLLSVLRQGETGPGRAADWVIASAAPAAPSGFQVLHAEWTMRHCAPGATAWKMRFPATRCSFERAPGGRLGRGAARTRRGRRSQLGPGADAAPRAFNSRPNKTAAPPVRRVVGMAIDS